MATIALMTTQKVYASEAGHWYTKHGLPAYEQPKKDGSGMRNTTLADARKQNLLPSATTILSLLDKPALTRWRQVNAIEAALTTPRLPGEDLDTFAERVLNVDTESIGDAAKQRGTDIHALIEQALAGYGDVLSGNPLSEYVLPVLEACRKFGAVQAAEKVVVGDGYAGKLDAVFSDAGMLTVVDFKTSKTMPKSPYVEHRLQLACYAKAFGQGNIQTANIYIDSNNPGKLAVYVDTEWHEAYENGFKPLLAYWQWVKGYTP